MPIRRRMAVLLIGVSLLSLSGCQLLDGLWGTFGNQAPVALCLASHTSDTAALTVTFNAADSYDPDGMIVSYDWAFGDGQTDRGQQVIHTYQRPDNYRATLTVTDEDGATGRDFIDIELTVGTPGAAPSLIDHAIARDVQDSVPVDRTRVFGSADRRAYVWLKVGPGSGVHVSAVEWYTPQGELYMTTTDAKTGFGHAGEWTSYSVWHWISFQDSRGKLNAPPSAYPGLWQVVAYIDDEQLFVDQFELLSSDPSEAEPEIPELYSCSISSAFPLSVVEGENGSESIGSVLIFEEGVYETSQGHEVDVDVAVDRLKPGAVAFHGEGDLWPGQLSNMTLRSYYVHWDPSEEPPTDPVINCNVDFGTPIVHNLDEPIVGLILTARRLDASDTILSISGTRYPTGVPSRGIDFDMGDGLILWADRRTISINYRALDEVDAMRVLTLVEQPR